MARVKLANGGSNKFGSLLIGDFFTFGGDLYIKFASSNVCNPKYNAINLRKEDVSAFNYEDCVIRIPGEKISIEVDV